MISEFLTDGNRPAGDLHPRETFPSVARYFENARRKLLRIHRGRSIEIQACEELADALHFQSRTEKHRKELALRHQHLDIRGRYFLAFHDPAKQIFIAECEILLQVCVFEIVEQSLPDEARVEGLFGGVGRVGRHYSAFCARGCSACGTLCTG